MHIVMHYKMGVESPSAPQILNFAPLWQLVFSLPSTLKIISSPNFALIEKVTIEAQQPQI